MVEQKVGIKKINNNKKKISVKSFLKAIRIPVGFAVINVFAQFLYSLLPIPVDVIIFNSVRIALYFWAGLIITSHGLGGLWLSGKAGATLLFVDHVIMRGGMFLFLALIGKVSVKFGLMSFGGVIVSYLMFVLIAVLLGALGGFSGRRIYNRKQIA
jgi:hypothetical protein